MCCSRSQIAATLTHRIQPHSSFPASASRAAASRGRRSGPLDQVASKSPRVRLSANWWSRIQSHAVGTFRKEDCEEKGARSYEHTSVCVRRLHMTSGLDEPSGLGWQCADSRSYYSVRGSATAASAFAITASARPIAALSSSLFQASTEWPSSNDRSLASRARATNSRSAATASESSLASAPFREDCVTSLSPSHRNYGPPGNIVTKDDHCNRPRSRVRRLARAWLCSGCSSGGSCGTPIPRQQFIETIDGMSIDHPRAARRAGRRRVRRR